MKDTVKNIFNEFIMRMNETDNGSELSEGLGERLEPARRLEHDNDVVKQRVQQKLVLPA